MLEMLDKKSVLKSLKEDDEINKDADINAESAFRFFKKCVKSNIIRGTELHKKLKHLENNIKYSAMHHRFEKTKKSLNGLIKDKAKYRIFIYTTYKKNEQIEKELIEKIWHPARYNIWKQYLDEKELFEFEK